jgi:hypothetical protein
MLFGLPCAIKAMTLASAPAYKRQRPSQIDAISHLATRQGVEKGVWGQQAYQELLYERCDGITARKEN